MLQLWVVVQALLFNAFTVGWLPDLPCDNYLLFAQNKKFLLSEWDRLHNVVTWSYAKTILFFVTWIRLFKLGFFLLLLSESGRLCSFCNLNRWMKDNSAFLSTFVYIHVVLTFRHELGFPLFLLTAHLFPLEHYWCAAASDSWKEESHCSLQSAT